MTVLHVTPYFAPAWAFGGVCRAVSELARTQAAVGHSVIVLTTDVHSRSSRLPAGEAVVDGVRVLRLPLRSLWVRARLNLSTPIGFRRSATRVLDADGVDIIHCHELRTVETLSIAALASRRGVPLVLSPHGTVTYSTGRTSAKRGWDRLFAARMLPRVAHVVALTEAEASDVRALWARYRAPIGRDDISVVPNGVDADALAHLPARGAARQRWRLGGGPVVLFLGRLAERKGVALLIAAFAGLAQAMPAAQLLLAGPDEGMSHAIAALIRDLGLAEKVVLTGLLSDSDRLSALAAADCFALPAIGEGFSLAVLEAMACGLPVLLSPDCQFPGVAGAQAGVIVPRDVTSWTEALRALLTDQTARTAMGGRARDFVRAHYTWTDVVHRMDAAYAGALRRHGRAC